MNKSAWSTHEMTLQESLEVSNKVAWNTRKSTRPNVDSKGPNPNTSKGRDGPAQGSDDHVTVLGTVFTANKVRRSVL